MRQSRLDRLLEGPWVREDLGFVIGSVAREQTNVPEVVFELGVNIGFVHGRIGKN